MMKPTKPGRARKPSPVRIPVHPYLGRPDHQFWRKESAIHEPGAFDPVVAPSFTIGPDEPVVTAGSCFAQHVAKWLASSGYNFLVAEQPHPLIPPDIAKKFNYRAFSARYGNVYTARQLRQLIDRAWGRFAPQVDAWEIGRGGAAGRVVDPFRPQIHPGGFVSCDELIADRQQHFDAVRRAFETMDVFVFTLGLTETWFDRRDGAVYPVAPGVAGGRYDPQVHGFVNFGVEETTADLLWSLRFLREINPSVKIMVTVSPVPLNATAVDRHVFVSTTWSKAVLRIAAQQVVDQLDACDYFPSYEIITSPYARGAYFGPDCRDVTSAGVDHVMQRFMQHYGTAATRAPSPVPTELSDASQHIAAMQRAMDVLCDEDAITNTDSDTSADEVPTLSDAT